MSTTALSSILADTYRAQSTEIEQQFAATGDGVAATRARSQLVDRMVTQLYQDVVSRGADEPRDFSLVAVGGYGRQGLYPYSDIDLVFLCGTERASESWREVIAAIARALWDLRLRVGHSTRTLAECGRIHRDNLEFSISLLDARRLIGDAQLFARLRDQTIPQLVARDRQDLVGDLIEMTRRRHRKHGDTIFHLEPNLKEAPGGLRDYQVCRWMTLIAELDRTGRWVEPEEQWPMSLQGRCREAFEFLAAARCFLHIERQRDDNHLTYELQDRAASLGIGQGSRGAPRPCSPSDWMRSYFRHARSIDRLASEVLDEAAPARSSLYGLLQDWRSRLSNADFAVVRGRIFPRQPAAALDHSGLLLDLFEMTAHHGLELSREAERWVEEAVRSNAGRLPDAPGTWKRLGRILVLPHGPHALRAMHRLGLLVALFPEFGAIDALVIRDFYHRYTVDEHSFMTVQNLSELGARANRRAPSAAGPPHSPSELVEGWEQRFAEIYAELERPELLLLALLFHDVGKGMTQPNHVEGSLEAVESIFARQQVVPEDRETIRFLISSHLEMSATLRHRDIFDPDVVRAFAEKVGAPERLKMLCLLTYADIKAVNPEALTPWKAEMLWRLYAATANRLVRNLDEERVHALAPAGVPEAEPAKAPRVRALLAASDDDPGETLGRFLEGFPRRYLETQSPEQVADHYRMARRLPDHPVEIALRKHGQWNELTVLTLDRPFLFASITGALAAWGMNILKADAFGNTAGLVLDTFRFVDLYRTLELNPSEVTRFRDSVVGVLTRELSLPSLMSRRPSPSKSARLQVEIPTQVRFDDASSSHSTLLELVARDRPGLLYRVSSTLAELGCNIEVALIDTEGVKAIDVFYLTSGGAKLDPGEQEKVRAALLSQLSNP